MKLLWATGTLYYCHEMGWRIASNTLSMLVHINHACCQCATEVVSLEVEQAHFDEFFEVCM